MRFALAADAPQRGLSRPRRAGSNLALWTGLLLFSPACQRVEPGGTTGTPGGDADTTTGGDAGAGTFASPDACGSSQDCDTDGHCVAPYDPVSPGGDRGQTACVNACIDVDDIGKWCIDDASCCERLRCNPVDGFCEPRGLPSEDSGTGGAATGTTGAATSTGTSTDTGSSPSTDSGTSTGTATGTDTGAATDTATSSGTSTAG